MNKKMIIAALGILVLYGTAVTRAADAWPARPIRLIAPFPAGSSVDAAARVITPRVAENGQILLEIEQEVSDVKNTTSSTLNSPTIQQRRVKTTVSVNSGGSVVLAGLMRDKATRQNSQIPLIGDIPLVGNLFKNKDDLIERTELLIAITPQVIRDNAQIGLVASEYRDRMNFTTRPQRDTPPDRHETFDRLVR